MCRKLARIASPNVDVVQDGDRSSLGEGGTAQDSCQAPKNSTVSSKDQGDKRLDQLASEPDVIFSKSFGDMSSSRVHPGIVIE